MINIFIVKLSFAPIILSLSLSLVFKSLELTVNLRSHISS